MSRGERKRLDEMLVMRGMAESLPVAQALIMAGEVLVDDEPAEKSGLRYYDNVAIRLRSEAKQFVSRGGEKLNAALDHFKISVQSLTVVDVGSSTGGFTDCLLQRGAAHVYAVDVGRGLLAHRIACDSRVTVMENTNARDLESSSFVPPPTFFVADVSFISLEKILASILSILATPAAGLVLVKPQFELPAHLVAEGGVVPERDKQLQAVQAVRSAAEKLGLEVSPEFASPIRGEKKGNQEYFLYVQYAQST